MNYLTSLPYHILDNICSFIPRKEVVKLSILDWNMNYYINSLGTVQIKYESVCITNNKLHELDDSNRMKPRRTRLENNKCFRFMKTNKFFYWNSSVLENCNRLQHFLFHITVFSFDSPKTSVICEFIKKMPHLEDLEIMNAKCEEEDVIDLLEAIQINQQKTFTFKLNRCVALTEKIMQTYFTKCHSLPFRNVHYGMHKYPGSKPTRPKTIEGIVYFMTTDNIREENRQFFRPRAEIVIGLLDEGTITEISNILNEKLANLTKSDDWNDRRHFHCETFLYDTLGGRKFAVHEKLSGFFRRVVDQIEKKFLGLD